MAESSSEKADALQLGFLEERLYVLKWKQKISSGQEATTYSSKKNFREKKEMFFNMNSLDYASPEEITVVKCCRCVSTARLREDFRIQLSAVFLYLYKMYVPNAFPNSKCFIATLLQSVSIKGNKRQERIKPNMLH